MCSHASIRPHHAFALLGTASALIASPQMNSGVDLVGMDHAIKPGDDFFSYANGSWCSKIRDAALRQQLATDVHAPESIRAQAVRNLDGWYPAFEVKQGEKLYFTPEQRVKIW